MKKFLLFLAVFVHNTQCLAAPDSGVDWTHNGDVLHLSPTNFRRFRMKQKKNFMTLFYSKDDLDIASLKNEYADTSIAMAKTISLVAVNCDSNKRACKMFKVTKTPKVKWFSSSLPVGIHVDVKPLFSGELIHFLNLRIGSTPPPEKWAPENGKVEHLTASGFHRYRLKTENFLTLFYDQNCHHCRSMMPHYAEASMKASDQIPFTALDCTAHINNQILCMREQVNQFPTLQIYEGGAKFDNTTGSLDLKTIFKVVRIVTGIEVEAPDWEVNGKVMHVTDSSFADFRATHAEFLLMFYAPWCQHCKTFKPIYAEASEVVGSLMPFAAIDCSANNQVCLAEGVGGYPTLKLFEDGEEMGQPYEHGQSVGELLEFAQLRSGKAPEPPAKWENNQNVQHLDSFLFSSFAERNEAFLAFFYSPTCSACTHLKKGYAEASRHAPLPMVAIDCQKSVSLCSKFDVKSMPRLLFIRDADDAEIGDGEAFVGSHKSTSYVRYLQMKSGELTQEDWDLLEEGESVSRQGKSKWFPQTKSITGVDSASFEDFRELNGKAFVFFYAPWCTHCKGTRSEFKYSSKWAQEFAPQVAYAAVDCTVDHQLCSEQGVTGYPTLKLYRNSQDSEGFKFTERERTESKFNEFVAFFSTEKPDPGYEPVVWEENGAVVHLTDYSFDEFKEENDDFLVMFYAPWCDASQRLMTVYAGASWALQDEMPLTAVDCILARDLCGSYTLNSFPQIYHFSDGEGKHEVLRSEAEIVEFSRRSTGSLPPATDHPAVEGWKSNGAVAHLTDGSFSDYTLRNKQFMAFFYAPWCGHCKRAKPEFAAASLQVEDVMPMAAVNCEDFRSTCQRFQVKGFPTILMVLDGKKDETYTGARTAAAFAQFLRRRAALYGDSSDGESDGETNAMLEWKEMGRVSLFESDRAFGSYLADSSDMGVMAYYYDPDVPNAVQGLPYIRIVAEYTYRFCPIVALNCRQLTDFCGRHGAKMGEIAMFQDADFTAMFDGVKEPRNIVRWALMHIGMDEEEFKMKYTTFPGKGRMEDTYNTITRVPVDSVRAERQTES